MVDHPGIWLGGQSGLREGSHLVLGLGARRVSSLLAKEGGDRVSPLSWVCFSMCSVWVYPVETGSKHMVEKRRDSLAAFFHCLQSCAAPSLDLSRMTS